MPKTEVILTHNVVGLGAESDQVKVAAGYARNYLFPQGLAIPLTAANKRRLESLRQRRAEREAHELNSMTELARGLSKMVLTVMAKTGDDSKMFGAITSGMIADELKHQFDVALDKKKIQLEHPLRTLGEHEIELRLHAEVTTKLKILVKSDKPQAAPEAPPARESKPRDAAAERGKGAPARGRPAAKEEVKAVAAPGTDDSKKERGSRKPRPEKKEKAG